MKLTVLSHDLGTEKEIMLVRMATSAIADNVRMFEIFTALKVSFDKCFMFVVESHNCILFHIGGLIDRVEE